MARFAVLFVLFAFAAVNAANIKFDGEDGDQIVLANFGDAMISVSVLYKGPSADAQVSESDIFSVGQIETKEAKGGYTNYTIPLTFKTVGKETYTVTIGSESITGTATAAGFVVLDGDGEILSGDEGKGISVGQEGTYDFTVKTVGTDGSSSVDISGTKFSFKESRGAYMKEVDESKTSISSDSLTIAIAQYRVGTGSFMIMMEAEAIEYQGEFFETVLNVNQETSPEPPCVAIGGDYSVVDGSVKIPMFNLLTPPKASEVETVTIEIDGESTDWDKPASTLVLPDQFASFKVTTNGKATITCDGEEAIIDGEITISGATAASPTPTSTPSPTPDADLATSLITDFEPASALSEFTAKITVVKGDPDTLSREDGQAILDLFCSTIVNPENCAITEITRGSAVIDLAASIDQDDVQESEDALRKSFDSCDFQTELGYECDELKVTDLRVQAVAGVGGASAGLAAWAIILIACVGAFALILVIVLGLWAVYRRSAEQSESDYSSSGPLGVPDPSDLLYEQSIVRDIYGRGDFPEGGPSQAVAEQRAREADLREEFPRPPSSSGLSRGANTDDASSTYSV